MLSSSALTAAACGLQPLLEGVPSKRLLLHGPRLDSVSPVAAPASHKSNSLNAHVITILSVVLCALIGAVLVSVVVRCALSVSRCVWPEVPREPGPCLPADYAAAARVKGEEAVAAASGVIVYSSEPCGGGGSECAICLSEFAPGERVRVLLGCNHGFHVHCIDCWLVSRPSCPTCRRCLFDGEHVHPIESAGSGHSLDEP